ncbi:hypothetical protein EES43_17150 [Streptomyces sp. ADI96-02]|nr:hypothetical protein EES43_17150 [Streptomyces sp. ADI96-02]
MKFASSMRSSSVRWAAPFVLPLTLIYYFAGESTALDEFYGYAPALIAAPLMTLYALAYATAAALAVWESGRLKASGIWMLAPARSRYRIAANALAPTILLSWLVLILPAGLSLTRTTIFPTTGSLRLPAMAAILCVAYSVIGFGIGLKVPRLIAAPITAVVGWVAIAFSRAVQPYWVRHISGQYTDIGFGELPSYLSLLPPILFAGSISVAVATMWLPVRRKLFLGLLACGLTLGGVYGAQTVAKDWNHNPPLIVGQADMTCIGNSPKVCMPQSTSSDLQRLRNDAVSVLKDLHDADVERTPSLITDNLADGRYQKRSTAETWRMGLTTAANQGDARYQFMLAAVRFPCDRVDPIAGPAVVLWAAKKTGQAEIFERRATTQEPSPQRSQELRQIHDIVNNVLSQSREKQAAWFYRASTQACTGEAS